MSQYQESLSEIYDSILFRRDWSSSQSMYERVQGYFPYISLPPHFFEKYMRLALNCKPKAKTFIDVGCGIGDKPYLARKFFNLDASGIEYNKKTYQIAREKVSNYVNLINADAFTHDYSLYDIIYMFMPIQLEARMRQLWQHILQSARPGTLMIEAHPVYFIQYSYNAKNRHLFDTFANFVKPWTPFRERRYIYRVLDNKMVEGLFFADLQ